MKPSLKNMPKLKLVELLRRRKMSLRQLLDEFGITTYDGLLVRCSRLGVLPPEEQEFKLAMPDTHVNNPSEGVVVFVTYDWEDDNESKTQTTVPETLTTTESAEQLVLEPTEPSQKKLRKKKEVT